MGRKFKQVVLVVIAANRLDGKVDRTSVFSTTVIKPASSRLVDLYLPSDDELEYDEDGEVTDNDKLDKGQK